MPTSTLALIFGALGLSHGALLASPASLRRASRSLSPLMSEAQPGVQRGEPMPWKLGTKTAVEEPVSSSELPSAYFYCDEVDAVAAASTSCWLAPEDDPNGQYICASDAVLAANPTLGATRESYPEDSY